MRKILFVVESLSGGGAEKVLVTLIKHLDETKFDITVLTVVNTGVYVEEMKRYCRVNYILPDYNSLNKVGQLKYKIQYKKLYQLPVEQVYKKYVKEAYDLEIAFVEGYATKFVSGSWNDKSKKICWLHTDMEINNYSDQYYHSLEEQRDVYQKYDRVYAVSESVKEAFERKFNLKNKVEIQYNPIDENEIKKKAESGIPKKFQDMKGLKIITVGRLEKAKGYDRLLDVMGKNKKYLSGTCLWILGDGAERGKLQQLVDKYQINAYVYFLGFQKNPYAWMNQADVFFCSSRSEGFSTVATEAMILGKPIFTTDCAGMRELFGGYCCGEIFENSVEGIQCGILKLLRDKERLRDYSVQVQKRAEEIKLKKRIREIEEKLSL